MVIFSCIIIYEIQFPIVLLLWQDLSYVLADALDLSGIMSVFWCGIVFNHYGAYRYVS